MQVSYKCWMKQVCTQKMRWGRRAARPGNDTQGETVGVCRNLMAHEGCRDCWFRLRRTLDERWKYAQKQTRHCRIPGKQHACSPSASIYSPLAQRVRADDGRRWKAGLGEMIIDRWIPSMWKTKEEYRFFFFSIRTCFCFLLGLYLPGRRTMWKKDIVLSPSVCVPGCYDVIFHFIDFQGCLYCHSGYCPCFSHNNKTPCLLVLWLHKQTYPQWRCENRGINCQESPLCCNIVYEL